MKGVFQQPIPNILKEQLDKENDKPKQKFVECPNCQRTQLLRKNQKFCSSCFLPLNKKVIKKKYKCTECGFKDILERYKKQLYENMNSLYNLYYCPKCKKRLNYKKNIKSLTV
ncbi:unnamed protein product, partial [marine sediment metagenome]